MLGSPALSLRLLAAGSGLMLAMAAYFEHILGLHPCTMCYWQRIPHWIAVILGGISLIPALPVVTPRHLLVLMALALLVGAGIAGWHSGVELKILPGPTACSGGMALDGDPSVLLDQLLAAPVVRCDEVPWSLFGLSMASWNGLISLAMAGAALASFLLSRRNRPQA
ncbi:MAG: disulfide bond formation protein B [Alphaproteobacteria bacterium]|nr:disulfide bond formation protein B [Alphaproteobacteria bacterium]